MSQAFNPYREWLGITSDNPLPNYYELLGLPPLEADTGKINAAYQRQSGRLTSQLGGYRAEMAHRLMGELAEARMTLMTPTAKRAYDQTLAARVSTASSPVVTQRESPSATEVDDMLPPAAAPDVATGVSNISAAPQAYPSQPYPAGSVAPQAHAVAQGYPAQGYGTWQPQPVAASPYPAAGYHAPQATALGPTPAPASQVEAAPVIHRRPARRRSSPAPALLGVALVVAALLGGLWYHFQGNKTVAVGQPSGSSTGNSERTSQTDHQVDRNLPRQRNSSAKDDVPPAVRDQSQSDLPEPGRPDQPGIEMPTTDKPGNDMPAADKPEPESTKPEPDKPQTDTPPEKPTQAKPMETKADADEAAAVEKALKAVRAALANRDLTKAKDLLDEATIEASASDSLAAVKRVEALTNYVEMFWDAARKTLPKLQAAEAIEIDGTMMAVVEADEEHLIVRSEGRNREYTWKKLPPKLAYYLADRWLAKDEPIRNLVLAAFEIIEPKGDKNRAESMVDAAAAAGLDAEPLREELNNARGE